MSMTSPQAIERMQEQMKLDADPRYGAYWDRGLSKMDQTTGYEAGIGNVRIELTIGPEGGPTRQESWEVPVADGQAFYFAQDAQAMHNVTAKIITEVAVK